MPNRQLLPAFLVHAFLFISFFSFAQDKVVTGRVADSTGIGISGVSVSVKGLQSRGTTTSNDGAFSLSVPANATALIFSSVGYVYQEVNISGKTSADVILQSIAGNLNEVVVIGYGTRQKKDLTGAVTSITAKDFNKGSITTPEQLIAGKVAGVQITSNGGAQVPVALSVFAGALL